MEEKMRENQISQPKVEQTPMAVPEKKVKPLTIVILLIVILLIVAGAVYAGYQIGRRSLSPRELLIPPKPITTQIPIDNGPVEIEVSPTPEVPADWRTYRNDKFSYSIKYPKDWDYFETDDLGHLRSVVFSKVESDLRLLTISVNSSEYLDDIFCGKKSTCIEVAACYASTGGKMEEIIIGRVLGRRVFVSSRQDISFDFACLEKEKRAYEFWCLHGENPELMSVCDKMLSTFRFD